MLPQSTGVETENIKYPNKWMAVLMRQLWLYHQANKLVLDKLSTLDFFLHTSSKPSYNRTGASFILKLCNSSQITKDLNPEYISEKNSNVTKPGCTEVGLVRSPKWNMMYFKIYSMGANISDIYKR